MRPLEGASAGFSSLTLCPLKAEDIEATVYCGLDAWGGSVGALFDTISYDHFEALENILRYFLLSVLCDRDVNAHENTSRVILAKMHQTVLGFCCFDVQQAYVSDLWIARQWQGNGIGGTLLDSVCSALNSKGHTSVSLEVLQQNEQAITFFKRRAFVETTERPDYDPVLKRKINKYVMEKRL